MKEIAKNHHYLVKSLQNHRHFKNSEKTFLLRNNFIEITNRLRVYCPSKFMANGPNARSRRGRWALHIPSYFARKTFMHISSNFVSLIHALITDPTIPHHRSTAVAVKGTNNARISPLALYRRRGPLILVRNRQQRTTYLHARPKCSTHPVIHGNVEATPSGHTLGRTWRQTRRYQKLNSRGRSPAAHSVAHELKCREPCRREKRVVLHVGAMCGSRLWGTST
jgi:hypothetical protein